jgi:hypothetical protein
VAATASDMILAAFGSRLLACAPTAISRLAWASPIDESRVLADAVGISTWRVGVATLWITSVEDTTALTYDFHTTHNKTNIIM